MPLLAQWVRQRPWLSAGLVGAAGGVVGIASGVAAAATAVGALAVGSVSSKSRTYEHPLRQRILSTLEQHPGLCYNIAVNCLSFRPTHLHTPRRELECASLTNCMNLWIAGWLTH